MGSRWLGVWWSRRRAGCPPGGNVDVALLQKLMADAGRVVFAGLFDEPTPEI